MKRVRLNFDDPAVRNRVVKHAAQCRGFQWFELSKARRLRSLPQNAYLHGVVYPMVRDGIEALWGEPVTSEQVHELFKAKFLPQEIINRNTGEVVDTIPGSTASLDTSAFSQYVESIRAWSAEFLGITIPDPDPSYQINREPAHTETFDQADL